MSEPKFNSSISRPGNDTSLCIRHSAVPCVISVEEVFRDSAAGLGDAVPVAVAEYLLHRGRPHRLPQPRLTREGGTQTDDVAVARKITSVRQKPGIGGPHSPHDQRASAAPHTILKESLVAQF